MVIVAGGKMVPPNRDRINVSSMFDGTDSPTDPAMKNPWNSSSD
jgi:hypothetical protein